MVSENNNVLSCLLPIEVVCTCCLNIVSPAVAADTKRHVLDEYQTDFVTYEKRVAFYETNSSLCFQGMRDFLGN